MLKMRGALWEFEHALLTAYSMRRVFRQWLCGLMGFCRILPIPARVDLPTARAVTFSIRCQLCLASPR